MTSPVDPRIRWGVPSAIVGLVVFGAVIASGFLVTRPFLHATGIDPNAFSFWATLVLDAIAIAVVVIVVRTRGSGSLATDVGLRIRPLDLVLGPAVGIGAKIVAVLILAIVLLLTRADLSSLHANVPFDRSSVWSWLLLGVIGCAVAPFAEELLFRGLVLRGVQRSILRRTSPTRGGRALAAIVAIGVSAVLFAGFHLYEATSPLMVAVLGSQILFIGIVHGVLTVVTGRLAPAIGSHIANNAIAFGLLAAFPQLAGLSR